MTKPITINDLAIGTKIYYNGDVSNASDFGIITGHREATKYSAESVDILLEDGRVIPAIMPIQFGRKDTDRFQLYSDYISRRNSLLKSLYGIDVSTKESKTPVELLSHMINGQLELTQRPDVPSSRKQLFLAVAVSNLRNYKELLRGI